MGKLIAIEGIDGSGKNTQSNKILSEYSRTYAKVSKLSFPRYGETFFGKEVGHYLNGEFGRLDQVHPKLSAMLYAGDRFECKEDILGKLSDDGVIICDRYVQSNIAHQIAKVASHEQLSFAQWIEELEYRVYGMPKPDLVIFLDVPPVTSNELVLKKEPRNYTDKKRDLHEEDVPYLEKVYGVFKSLSKTEGWATIDCLDGGRLLDEAEIFIKIKDVLVERGMLIR